MPAEENSRTRPFLIGVISDTHGYLHPAVHEAFAGVDAIVHAGDVGNPGVYFELCAIAPLVAVRGNTDAPGAPMFLRDVEAPMLGGVRLYVTHRLEDLPRPLPDGTALVVIGHSHRPRLARDGDALVLNPGSASRPRGPEGRTAALVKVEHGLVEAHFLPLEQR